MPPPYSTEVAERLGAMMPKGVPPIGPFRTFVRNLPMTEAMGTWGAYEPSRRLSLSLRDREIVIDRTTARCGCEYEWGVHIVFFAERAGLTDEQVRSLTHGSGEDACWTDERERLLFLCGWYHAISFAANGAGVALEAAAPRFADVA